MRLTRNFKLVGMNLRDLTFLEMRELAQRIIDALDGASDDLNPNTLAEVLASVGEFICEDTDED